jgi:hypothetical protein
MWIVEESEVGDSSDENWTSGLKQEKGLPAPDFRRNARDQLQRNEIRCQSTVQGVIFGDRQLRISRSEKFEIWFQVWEVACRTGLSMNDVEALWDTNDVRIYSKQISDFEKRSQIEHRPCRESKITHLLECLQWYVESRNQKHHVKICNSLKVSTRQIQDSQNTSKSGRTFAEH